MEIKEAERSGGRWSFAGALAKAWRDAGPGAKAPLETCLESRTPPRARANNPLSVGKGGKKETKSDLIGFGRAQTGLSGCYGGKLEFPPNKSSVV